MKSILDINSTKKQLAKLTKPIRTHHVLIAFIIITGIIAYTLYTVNNVLSQPSDEQYTAEQQKNAISTKFDEDTIDKVNKLKNRQENSSNELPPGRINPFTE